MSPALLLVSAVFAASPAYYHPEDVAAKSASFAAAAESSGPAFDAAQSAVSALGRSLEDLDLGVALLGKAAPPELAQWSEATRRAGLAGYLQVQKHVDLLQEDYAKAFEAALDRALPRVSAGYDVVVCQARRSFGPAGASASACKGEDLNAALARALDADAALARELAAISAVPWPTPQAPSAAQPVVALSGTARWISASELARAFYKDRLIARKEVLEDAMAPLEEGVDAGEADAIAGAQALRDAWAADLAQDGDALRAAVTAALGRAHADDVGLCANPAVLGGCAGADVTRELLPVLEADKKLNKMIEKYAASHPVNGAMTP